LTFFDEQLKKGSFHICFCKNCKENLWPVREICNICNEKTHWRESMNVGKIIEFSKKDSFYFGIIELDEKIRIMGKIMSKNEPEIGQIVTMNAFFDKRPHYLFTVENN
tara:strand:- start:28 stop:351 length:324 start_codon:yes stop_codon:yes gene_type:complete